MTLSGLVDLFCTEPTIIRTVDDARGGRQQVLDLTSPPADAPLHRRGAGRDQHHGGAGRPVLIVTSTFREAEGVTATLESLLGEDEVAYYPAWETLPHERLSPRSDTVGRRLAVLRRLAGHAGVTPPKIIVAPIRSVLQPQVKGLADL